MNCFFTKIMLKIWTNPFGIHVGNILLANTNVQFIFDLYATISYYSSYLTKINKIMTKELKNIIISSNEKKMKHILAFERWEVFFLMFKKC
jgi:hypothetical protein